MAAGSTTGNIFKVTTWGESHGKGIGVVVDGCPAGLSLCEEDIQIYLDRRKPGQSKFTTQRKEEDRVEIVSGVFEGKTTGTPIAMMIPNKDQRSRDYGDIVSIYRPGHADYCFDEKFGFRDYRGGGRSSGRETAARVAAGAVAMKVLKELGIEITAYTKSIGPVSCAGITNDRKFKDNGQEAAPIETRENVLQETILGVAEEAYQREMDDAVSKETFLQEYRKKLRDERDKNYLYMPDQSAAVKAEEFLNSMIEQKDSVGGVIECQIHGMPAGIGEPVFDKLSARLAAAVCSIGAVKGFEIGEGFHASVMNGSEHNDSFYYDETGSVQKASNHSGGILGGMSDGSPLIFRAAFKPTPSIGQLQNTINKARENVETVIRGRHDPIIVPRAVVVVEAMAAITVLDLLLTSMTARLDGIKKFFQ